MSGCRQKSADLDSRQQPVPARPGEVQDEAFRRAAAYRAAVCGQWITNAAGNGWILLDELGNPVEREDGSLLELRYAFTRGPKVPGNLDLDRRPIMRNADGSMSTVRTISIGTDQGEVVIPTVSPDGRIWGDAEAIGHYRKTGEHFGIFETPEQAADFAIRLHKAQARQYNSNGMTGP